MSDGPCDPSAKADATNSLNGKLTIFERRWVRLNKQNNNFVKRIFKENELKRSLWDFYDQYDVNKEAVFVCS